MLFYISNKIYATLAPSLPIDPNYIIIDVFHIQLINVYNANHFEIPNNIKFLERDYLLVLFSKYLIFLKDFNIYHP
ncbi:hypothetical protein PZA11_007680 [Diplocarpon coronariae]